MFTGIYCLLYNFWVVLFRHTCIYRIRGWVIWIKSYTTLSVNRGIDINPNIVGTV